MDNKQTALSALQNLASNLDTTARIMRQLGNPYRNKSLELSVAYNTVLERIENIEDLGDE